MLRFCACFYVALNWKENEASLNDFRTYGIQSGSLLRNLRDNILINPNINIREVYSMYRERTRETKAFSAVFHSIKIVEQPQK